MRNKTDYGKGNERGKVELGVCKVKREFLAEMVADSRKLIIRDNPFTRPRLNPFLLSAMEMLRPNSVECGIMKREDGIDVIPSIETRSNTCSPIPFRRRNQKIHNPQSFRIGERFII